MRFQDKAKLAILLTCFLLAFGAIVYAELSWEDNWNRLDVDIEGFCSQVKECGAGYQPISCSNLPNNRYRTFSTASACTQPPNCAATAGNQILRFHGEDIWDNGVSGEGFPMISRQTFSKDKYISAEIRAKAYCGPTRESGCFFGLTIYNGESNYREIAYEAAPGDSNMYVYRYRSQHCDDLPLRISGTIAQNTFHTLRLDYYGHEGGKWVYFVDDVVQNIENADNPGSVLQAHPHVALFFVGKQYRSYVEGETAPLRVWTGNNEDARQAIQADGYAATQVRAYAQEVYMGGQNITKVRLFLVNQNNPQYLITAHTDINGKPGTLINQTTYRPDRYGFQDVPLWVPQRYIKIWIRIAAYQVPLVEFGTSAPGTNPYPGRLMYSDNNGASWTSVDRDMSFITYERK
jgi:hypothetical protein